MTQPTEQQGISRNPRSSRCINRPQHGPRNFLLQPPQFPTAVPQQAVSQQPMAMPPFAQSPMSVPEQAACPYQP